MFSSWQSSFRESEHSPDKLRADRTPACREQSRQDGVFAFAIHRHAKHRVVQGLLSYQLTCNLRAIVVSPFVDRIFKVTYFSNVIIIPCINHICQVYTKAPFLGLLQTYIIWILAPVCLLYLRLIEHQIDDRSEEDEDDEDRDPAPRDVREREERVGGELVAVSACG